MLNGICLVLALLTPQQMREDLLQLSAVASRAWSYAQLRTEVHIPAITRELSGRINAKTSPKEFGLILQEFAADLCDGHAGVYGDPIAWSPFQLPFTCEETSEGLVVSVVLDSHLNLRPGDRLLALDGVSADQSLERKIKVTGGSTPGQKRRRALKTLLERADESLLEVRTESANGTQETRTLRPIRRLSIDDGFCYYARPDGVGYLRLGSFAQDFDTKDLLKATEPKRKMLATAMTRLHDCRALILDLRDNQGGTDLLGEYLARILAPQAHNYYFLETQDAPEIRIALGGNAGVGRSAIALPTFEPAVPAYTGRLAVLMNEDSFSATDCLIHFLACERKDTLFIGAPEGAGAGAPRVVVKLKHSGVTFGCCTMRVFDPAGNLIEGHPIQPTLTVRPTRKDLQMGRDTVLEAALSRL